MACNSPVWYASTGAGSNKLMRNDIVQPTPSIIAVHLYAVFMVILLGGILRERQPGASSQRGCKLGYW
jgi:hypothetical protein